MTLSDARRRANAKYDAKTYKQVNLKVRKEELPVIKAHAEQMEESTTGFILRAVRETIERDNKNGKAADKR